MSHRRRVNTIDSIVDGDGNPIKGPSKIEKVAYHYFVEPFTS